MQYNEINRKLNGATYCVRMTNNGVTVNIACLLLHYRSFAALQISFFCKCHTL